ncbi:MAG: MFS transporter [Treponema sp.]|jgi:fucose permease|nr:MFS transporter [Treponema sp.]
MKLGYGHTRAACYLGYVSQAMVNNLGPLLFLTFNRQFGVSLQRLAFLVILNFSVQLLVDLAAVQFVDRIGYRAAALAAHVCCVAGLCGMGILPFVLPDPYGGLLIAVFINGLGGGLLEVIISPIVEALPGEHKAAAMSLLHSFSCWGGGGVVILSTVYFNLAGIDNWRWLPMLWALLPLGTVFLFAAVPLKTLIGESGAAIPLRELSVKRFFMFLFLMMICSGASEQAMSQWASLFAEAGLEVSKTLGDILGPCAFAILMGLARVLFGMQKSGKDERRRLSGILLGAGVLCILSYLITVFSPWPLLSLGGCALCGFSVGVMWPGTFSLAAGIFPLGGTAMFAILALAGDVGCAAGPGLVGTVMNGTTLKTGLLTAIVFPLILTAGNFALRGSIIRRNGSAAGQNGAS